MNRSRSSYQRYLAFVKDYKRRALDETAISESGGKRRKYLREYVQWLWPHRYAVGALFALALLGAVLQMVEPLFLRFIVDRVLLNTGLDAVAKLTRLNRAGALFLALIIVSNFVAAMRDYRQRLLNAW